MVADMRMTWRQPGTAATACAHLDRLVALQQISQETYQQISIHPSFVRLVNDDMADALKVGVARSEPAQNHSGGAEQELRLRSRSPLATDSVANRPDILVDVFHALIGDTGGDTDRGDSSRLRDDDARGSPSVLLDLVVEQELGQLCTGRQRARDMRQLPFTTSGLMSANTRCSDRGLTSPTTTSTRLFSSASTMASFSFHAGSFSRSRSMASQLGSSFIRL